MLKLTQQQEKKALMFVLAILVALIIYRMVTAEKPKTAPLAFPPGSVARSAVRQSSVDAPSGADPLNVIFRAPCGKISRCFPGPLQNGKPGAQTEAGPGNYRTATAAPPPPQQTPEEIAADLSRAELARFRFLGYLTAKDNTIFLSKDGELFIVKSGDKFYKNYQMKNANNDSVVLFDTITGVEMRISLAGGEPQQLPQQRAQQPAQQPQQPTLQPAQRPTLQPAPAAGATTDTTTIDRANGAALARSAGVVQYTVTTTNQKTVAAIAIAATTPFLVKMVNGAHVVDPS